MCGIIGYVGRKTAVPILVDGLRRMEYRGYDSVGLALGSVSDENLWIRKAVGRVAALEAELKSYPEESRIGIAHTRWATHGSVTLANAHPHTDAEANLALVHNGVIENADRLRADLLKKGVHFTSETDTEVLAHLIARAYSGDPVAAISAAIAQIQGTFGIVVLFRNHPDQLIAAKQGSPLVIGIGNEETIIASDPQAIVSHTRNVVYLKDGELVAISATDLRLARFDGQSLDKRVELLDEGVEPAEKDGHPHFLIKEIHEQPATVDRCIAGRLRTDSGTAVLGGLNLSVGELAGIRRVVPIGCGTGYHAGMITAMAVEHIARVDARAELAVDFCSRSIVADREALYLAFSQSGETADLLSIVQELQTKGCRVGGMINVVGSALARLCGRGVYIHAGPEVAVASTKAYSGHVTGGLLLALALGRAGILSAEEGQKVAAEIAGIPALMTEYLASPGPVQEAAEYLVRSKYVFFIGRGFSYPVALEGALKFKEEAYIPCSGYHAGEMKHGAIAMIEPKTPVVAIVPHDGQRERTIINIREAQARGAFIIAVHSQGDETVQEISDLSIPVPKTADYTSALLTTLPLHLLSYYGALAVGADVDKPRNLAKSVTVA